MIRIVAQYKNVTVIANSGVFVLEGCAGFVGFVLEGCAGFAGFVLEGCASFAGFVLE